MTTNRSTTTLVEAVTDFMSPLDVKFPELVVKLSDLGDDPIVIVGAMRQALIRHRVATYIINDFQLETVKTRNLMELCKRWVTVE